MTKCCRCTRPTPDAGYLCEDCAGDLERVLDLAAVLGPELEVTVTRRDRLGDGSGRATETPLPYNDTASEAANEVYATFERWARVVSEARGIPPAADLLARTLAATAAEAARTHTGRPIVEAFLAFASRARGRYLNHGPTRIPIGLLAVFLRSQVRWIRHQGRLHGPDALPLAEAAYMELSYAAGRIARVCGAHPTLTALGPCMTDGCDGTLRAPHGRATVRCRDCGQSYDVTERMEQLLAIGADYLFNARDLSSILSIWKRRRIAEGTVAAWATRGHMADRGKIGRAYVYRLGDATTIAERLYPDDTEKEATAA